jgi:hypothetical protein
MAFHGLPDKKGRCYVYSSHYNLLAQHVGPQFISSLNFSFKISCHPRTTSPRSLLHPSLIWDQISCHPRTTSPKVHVTLPSGAEFHVIPQQVPPCTPCCGMTWLTVLNDRVTHHWVKMYWDDIKSGLNKRGCNEHLLLDKQEGHTALNKKYRDNMNCKTTDNRKEQGTIWWT